MSGSCSCQTRYVFPAHGTKQQQGTQRRKGAKLQQLNDENGETPFQIPSNWLWLRIGALFEVAVASRKPPHVLRIATYFPILESEMSIEDESI